MRTVQELMLRLALRVDEIDVNDNVFELSTIGTVDGKIPKQKLLDIFNEAHTVLLGNLRKMLPRDKLVKEVSGAIERNTEFEISQGLGHKPDDMIYEIGITDSTGKDIFILPTTFESQIEPNEYVRFVYDEGNAYRVPNSTFIPDGDTYIFKYIKIPNYTLLDVTGGDTTDSIDEKYHNDLITIASAIAVGQSMADINKLTETLIQQRNN